MDHSKPKDDHPKYNVTVLVLCFCLLGLIFLLIFLYKMLNREAEGEYTIRRMVYKEGGVRDRVRGAALALGTRLGVRLWPHSDTDEYGEEIQDEEGQVEEGADSQGSDSDGGDQGDEEDCGETMGGGDNTSHEISSSEGSEAGEQTGLMDQAEVNEEAGEKEEKVVKGGGKGEASGGPGLLIDLKQFSGSAIWSEEEGGEGHYKDVTAL